MAAVPPAYEKAESGLFEEESADEEDEEEEDEEFLPGKVRGITKRSSVKDYGVDADESMYECVIISNH